MWGNVRVYAGRGNVGTWGRYGGDQFVVVFVGGNVAVMQNYL